MIFSTKARHTTPFTHEYVIAVLLTPPTLMKMRTSTSLNWKDGHYRHEEQNYSNSTWYDEVPHAWLRNDAVDGIFPTANGNLPIKRTPVNVAEIEKSLLPSSYNKQVKRKRTGMHISNNTIESSRLPRFRWPSPQCGSVC